MKTYRLLALLLAFAGGAYAQGEKRILLEEFSTAPCGFCPEGDLFAAQIIHDHPQVIWVTHHAGFGTDSMTAAGSTTVAYDFTNFAPGAAIDRGDYQFYPPYIAVARAKWDSVCTAHLTDAPVVDVQITGVFDSISRLLTCNVNASFITAPAPGDLRLNLYLVEDSIVGFGNGYDQTNYFNTTPGHYYFGAGNPIIGYVHHHVIRRLVSGAWGQSGVIPNSPTAGSSYSHTFSNIALPAQWKTGDMTLVAFVSYYNANTSLRQVLNSNEVPLPGLMTAIKPVQKESVVSVYPNPAKDRIILTGMRLRDASFRIVNIVGQTCPAELFTDLSVSVSGLRPGVYFLEAVSAQESVRVKFVKE